MSFEALLVLWFFLFLLSSITAKFLKLKPYCGCETCQAFLTSSWSLKYNNLCDWYTHLLSKSPTGTIHIHVLGNVVTSNPQNVEHMLKTKFANYPKGKPFHAILCDLLGDGIFNVDAHLWKFQRKIASLELGSVSVKSYAFDIINSEINTRLVPFLSSFVERNDQNAPTIDLQDVFRRLSFDSICKFSFGLDPKCLDLSLPISEFATAFDLASRLSAERAITSFPFIWKVKRLFNVGSEKQLKEAIGVINDLAYSVIRHKRKNGVSSSHEDLLSRFMGTIDDDKFLRDIVVSFLLAGRDTVASALTSFFWLLSNNPNVIKSIRQESIRILGDENERIKRFDQLRDMHYLNGAVHESMRLFPPVQFDSKFCEQDDVLPDGTFVRSGTRVTFHPYAMGRMETIWGPDCLEFKPERWLEDGVFKQKDPFKYPVFQAGPRVCLGKEMAIMEIKIVALCLIRMFDIKVVGSGQGYPKFVPGLTATIGGGLPVIVQEIK